VAKRTGLAGTNQKACRQSQQCASVESHPQPL
jgi:hypothetical protein